eukprot:CAMPEP_0194330076 /NCGR_PEP_ID=MMETSP0171-20130528/50477_1 /TAXON_ID=218684 /ORGANISM="Corethron pennatum, Strain L29A3" /LENGTH=68 /DNA_ID=CAMNT_0039091019 /DNA_START=287 /DNA_END=490 /DNA_ORIENTATION=+
MLVTWLVDPDASFDVKEETHLAGPSSIVHRRSIGRPSPVRGCDDLRFHLGRRGAYPFQGGGPPARGRE